MQNRFVGKNLQQYNSVPFYKFLFSTVGWALKEIGKKGSRVIVRFGVMKKVYIVPIHESAVAYPTRDLAQNTVFDHMRN